jgi:hypothetical protein
MNPDFGAYGIGAKVWTPVNVRGLGIRPREWAVDGMVSENKLNFFYGKGKAGKGQLVTYLCLCALNGIDFMGAATSPGPWLYLDGEDDEDEMGRRAWRISAGTRLAVPDDGFWYVEDVEDVLTRGHEIESIVAGMRERYGDQPIRIVADSMMAVFGGQQRDESYMTMALAWARKLIREYRPLTWIIVDHEPKEGRSLFGSVVKGNRARNTWEIVAVRKGVFEEGEFLEVSAHRAQSNYRISGAEWGARIEFRGDTDTGPIVVTPLDVADGAGLRGQILQAITNERLTTSQIAKAINAASVQSVRNELVDMERQGFAAWEYAPGSSKAKLWHRVETD